MVCPKCGTVIQDGYMYCPTCGEEVIMVPDFEVELEAGIEQTISEVAEMMADSVEGDNEEEAVSTDNIKSNKTGKNKADVKVKILIAVAAVLGLILVIGITMIVKAVRSYYSFDDQLKKVEEEFAAGDYEDAVKTARHVISINPDDEKTRFLLADSYYSLGKYDESIAVLDSLLDDLPNDRSIYERLISNYEAEGDIDSIIRLSERADATIFKEFFQDYVSESVEFSEEAGNYYGPQSIELMTSGNGTIYYTIDGSYPDEDSDVYTTPILLEEGETTIRAVHINDKGVKSEEVSKTYNIIKQVVSTPKILTQAGDYGIPKLIKLEEPSNGKIYYTTDGTDPTADSIEYEPPILMPLGKSEFRFVMINDSGESSDVVTAEYNLNISGIDKEYAAGLVQLTLISLGHDVSTHQFKAKYGYSQESRSFYIIEEYAGSARQNTVYAVDAQSGGVFTITPNSSTGDFDFGVVK
ncbi:MAG: chitobiase/beta-hexosaminidase C-terminal domain-containing protein [Lachnospiraceae bacterium]|nr:chitobiase/beta-hexosaminidase C-terminal domain-containing protein [Lachnospiraceae bacterium]